MARGKMARCGPPRNRDERVTDKLDLGGRVGEFQITFSHETSATMKPVLLLFSVFRLTYGYPTGAPSQICNNTDISPQHSFHKSQPNPVPYDIFMSRDHVTSLEDTVTVTITTHSDGPKFKGFFIIATDDTHKPIGTWENSTFAHSLPCSAITHNNPDTKEEATLTWKPSDKLPTGNLHMKAVIVQQFHTFWSNIPVPVLKPLGVSSLLKITQDTEASTKASSTSSSPKNKKRSLVDRLFGEETSTTSKPTTPKPTTTTTTSTTKRGSIIKRIFGSDTTSTTAKTTTRKPTTTVPSTTTKRGVFDRLFGGDTTTVKTTTPKPTTTTTVSTTTKRRSIINRVFGGGTTTPAPTTTKTTTKLTTVATTTTQQGFINRFFGGGSTTTTTKKPPKPTTTTTIATTTTKRRSLINRVFGGDTTTPTTTTTTTTPKPTTKPTTQKPGFFSGLFGTNSEQIP